MSLPALRKDSGAGSFEQSSLESQNLLLNNASESPSPYHHQALMIVTRNAHCLLLTWDAMEAAGDAHSWEERTKTFSFCWEDWTKGRSLCLPVVAVVPLTPSPQPFMFLPALG